MTAMGLTPQTPDPCRDESIGLDCLLAQSSEELARLAGQCGQLQWSISAILDTLDHPDLGAEIHMLQDIDRIQQTLQDLAAILDVAGTCSAGARLARDRVGASIRLESLRQRLGLSDAPPPDPGPGANDITWL
ncbi:MAG: hypothetical protein CSA74_07945 [Rhodobacterales bacterium]|nr:MAG: hypothetical protein CSA74_07945 [Rhodobacterales bacterium]